MHKGAVYVGLSDVTSIPHLGSKTEPAFIQKPFAPEALVYRVREVLAGC